MRPKLDQEFLDKVGVTTDEVIGSEGSRAMSLFGDLSEDQIARINKSMDDTYAIFKKRVAQGRKMTEDQVDKVARGRVFTGEQAMENGLIDQFGTFSTGEANFAQQEEFTRRLMKHLWQWLSRDL